MTIPGKLIHPGVALGLWMTVLLPSTFPIGGYSYPVCTDQGNWLYVAKYNHGSAVTDCLEACKVIHASTYFAVRRNGPEANDAACYHVESPPQTPVTGCRFKCNSNYQCGGEEYGETKPHSIYTVCSVGKYGASCTTPCPGYCFDGVCDFVFGECPWGCADGFHDIKCNAACPPNCADDKCDQDDAVCVSGCDEGWYTPQCTESCSINCKNTACGINVGICDEGCNDGWYTPQCTEQCSETCNGTTCALEDGSCVFGCNDGWYTRSCTQNCSANCFDVSCDIDTGHCNSGCKDGWFTPNCSTVCPGICNELGCNISNGYCNECKSGLYGYDCSSECSTNCSEADCLRETGYCYSCLSGLQGLTCDQPCPENCGGGVCDQTVGNCTNECESGWSGIFCEVVLADGSNPSNTGAIVGVCVAIVVLVAAVIAIVIFFWRRNQKSPPKDHEGNVNVGFDVSYENVSSAGPHEVVISTDEKMDSISVTSEHTIRVTHFAEYIQTLLGSFGMIDVEYESLPSEKLYEFTNAGREEVKGRNRFKGIYPYDHNRVVLTMVDGDPGSDYINASCIQGYQEEDRLIASMGPRTRTSGDFWRMVWQEKATTIIMLTNLVEAGVEKCDLYWPKKDKEMFGDVVVFLQEENSWPSYVVRTLTVWKNDEERTVRQYHFTQWPDHGVPTDGTALLDFRRKVFGYRQPGVPVIVHCSAGVGRTGTLIALDHLINQAEAEGKVDVYNCVYNLRHQRVHMVQSLDQYRFLHESLAEYMRVGTTTMSKATFRQTYKDGISNFPPGKLSTQFKMRQEMVPTISDYAKECALSPENRDKNRNLDIIPLATSRVYLREHHQDRNDYINAVRVNGFKAKDAFLVTQFPLADTVVDFWCMLREKNCDIIVVLRTNDQAQEASLFLPAQNQPMDVLDGVATQRLSMTLGSYRTIDLDYTPADDVNNEYMNVRDVPKWKAGTIKVHEIVVDTTKDCLDFQIVMEIYRHIQRRIGGKPVVVTCLDGAEYSGQFVACCNLLEILDTEQEVDVFQVCKYIRDNRPEFIRSLNQYRGLHDAVELYIRENDAYEN